MLFCPNCANFLVISDTTGVNRWVCQTCAYQFPITKQMTSRIQPEKKKVDDVIDSRVNFEGQPKVESTCDKCGHHEAYFKQLQIRSADEPMTTFYRCTACGAVKREEH